MENDRLRDIVTEEISQWSTWEALKFIGLVTVFTPSLVMEAGKEYIITKIKGLNDRPNS